MDSTGKQVRESAVGVPGMGATEGRGGGSRFRSKGPRHRSLFLGPRIFGVVGFFSAMAWIPMVAVPLACAAPVRGVQTGPLHVLAVSPSLEWEVCENADGVLVMRRDSKGIGSMEGGSPLCAVAVSDRGTVALASQGPEALALSVRTLSGVLSSATFPSNRSRHIHGARWPQVIALEVCEGDGPFLLTLSDERGDKDDARMLAYDVKSGRRVADLRLRPPSSDAKALPLSVSSIPGTPLFLLAWWVGQPRQLNGSFVEVLDSVGKRVWSRALGGDYATKNPARDALLAQAVWSKCGREFFWVERGEVFGISSVRQRSRTTYRCVQDENGWSVEPLRTIPWDPGVSDPFR